MTLKEGLVHRYVLDGYHMLLVDLYNLVDQQEGETMGNKLLYAVHINHGSEIGIIYRALNLGVLHFAAHHACEFVVDGVSRTDSHYPSLDWTAYKSEVADDVHQLVARRLVVPCKRFGIDISEFAEMHVGHMHDVANLVDLLLWNLLVVDHNRVVEISPLYEIIVEKFFNLADKDECACACHFLTEFRQIVENSKLVREHGRIIFHHALHAESVVGINGECRPCGLILDLRLLLYDIEIFVGIELNRSYTLYLIYIYN